MASGRLWIAATLMTPFAVLAQDDALSIKRLMLDRIHPASNAIQLAASRGAPNWNNLSANAKVLKETAVTLASKNTDAVWTSAANQLAAAGSDTEKAALAKSESDLPAIARHIDNSCTECHRHYRPNVFPPAGKGVGQ